MSLNYFLLYYFTLLLFFNFYLKIIHEMRTFGLNCLIRNTHFIGKVNDIFRNRTIFYTLFYSNILNINNINFKIYIIIFL